MSLGEWLVLLVAAAIVVASALMTADAMRRGVGEAPPGGPERDDMGDSPGA